MRRRRRRLVDVGAQAEAEAIYMAHPQGRRSAKLRALAECLAAAFGDPPYWYAGIDAPKPPGRSDGAGSPPAAV